MLSKARTEDVKASNHDQRLSSTTMTGEAFQDDISDNFCFGCSPANVHGLQIRSYWDGPAEALCIYQPAIHQSAGPKQFLNGGIIATLIDCHAICTAIAYAYQVEGRALGSVPAIWYVTGSLTVTYLRPTPITDPVVLRARVVEAKAKKSVLHCTLSSRGEECVRGEVIAIRVPPTWGFAE